MSDNSCFGYRQAAEVLPDDLKRLFVSAPESVQMYAEGFRLRSGRKPSVIMPDNEIELGNGIIQGRQLYDVIEIATGASFHSCADTIKSGFVTASGGHRIGICGTAVVSSDSVSGIRNISSLNIRIAKEIKTAAGSFIGKLRDDAGGYCSVLIAAYPGGGKTTALRDLVRRISDDGIRCSIADERSEIAAVKNGVPQLDVGRCSDIMDRAPRAEAVMMLLRCMSPQVIAMDEITAKGDTEALISCAQCGVKVFATAHAGSIRELKDKKIYKDLMDSGVFERVVLISGTGRNRKYDVLKQGTKC